MTVKIVVVTALAWALVAMLGAQDWAFRAGGFIPIRFDGEVSVPGALLPAIVTPLSATLLHADFMHLAFNMLMLAVCGIGVERAVGRGGALLLYIAGAFVAAAGHFLFNMGSPGPMIGASGAVSAMIGAYAMLYSKRREGHGGMRHVLQLAGAWIVIQLLIGLTTISSATDIAIAAHIAGFGAGLALARPLLLWRYRGA
ncbi:MAG: rhomboid family intramembrane serine protease [Sphingomonadaceae bacterium]|nr:rhomboid family intramembrane serine protease [Sphingomonadaceae bacterium]